MLNPGKALGRALLGSVFIFGGYNQLKSPDGIAKGVVEPKVKQYLGENALPVSSTQLVQINGATMLAAGSLLALGKMPRLSSAILAGALVPTTLVGHAFWEESDPRAKQQQTIEFVSNAAIFGGLLTQIFAPVKLPDVSISTPDVSLPSMKDVKKALPF